MLLDEPSVNASSPILIGVAAWHRVLLRAALATVLRDRPTLNEPPMSMSHDERLNTTAYCLQTDLDNMPVTLKSGFLLDPVPWPLFDQSLALRMAHSNLEVSVPGIPARTFILLLLK